MTCMSKTCAALAVLNITRGAMQPAALCGPVVASDCIAYTCLTRVVPAQRWLLTWSNPYVASQVSITCMQLLQPPLTYILCVFCVAAGSTPPIYENGPVLNPACVAKYQSTLLLPPIMPRLTRARLGCRESTRYIQVSSLYSSNRPCDYKQAAHCDSAGAYG
jgi:hypothetical protein